MSTAKPRSISKRVKIQNGWIWGGVLKEENKPTHFGFSHSWECVQSWLPITIPPKPACPPDASLLHQGTCAGAEERLGGVRELLFTVTMHTRGCAVAFSHQVWLVSAMLVAMHAFFGFFSGHWLWTPCYFSASILLTNDCSIQTSPYPLSVSLSLGS